MKFALFGAAGGTGQHIITQALEAGHQVNALVRTPGRLAVTNEDLQIIQGDVLDPEVVARTVSDTEAIIISLGNTPNNPDWVVSKGTEQIIKAMKEAGTRRVVAITSLGTGDSIDQVPFAFRLVMKSALKKTMEDKNRQEQLLMDSGLDWIIVRPGGLMDGAQTGQYKHGTDKSIKAGQVSRADVAEFTLRQLTDDAYLHQAPAIS